MAMQYLDMTGRTEEEAVQKALRQLGLDRDDVSVEVLERAKSGFFGFGASPAKVRVTYGLEEEEPVIPAAPPQPAPKKSAPAPEPKPERRSEPRAEEKAEKPGEEEPVPEKSGGGSRSQRRRKNKESRQEKAPKAEQAESVQSQPVQPEDLGEPCDDEKARQIRAFLDGLLQHMGSAAEVKVYQPEKGRYKVILEGAKLGALIGRRGETLDAIQQLTNYSVNRGSDKRVRIHVDAENYRLKREQSLQSLARKVAAKVVKYKRNVTLEPMNAYERHVIHTALQDVPGVTTYSMGTEPNRRVIVAYDKDKK